MKTSIKAQSLFEACVHRLGVLSEVEMTMRKLDTEESGLKKALLDAAPAVLQGYLKEELVLQDLFAHGWVSKKIHFHRNESDIVGISDYRALVLAFIKLKNAWKDGVRIRFIRSASWATVNITVF